VHCEDGGMTRSVFIKTSFIGLLITCLAGCGESAREQLGSERDAWEDVRPSRYRFDYTVTGFAPGGGPWRIKVNGAQVVSVSYAGSGNAPTPSLTAATAPTIETLFEQVSRAQEESAVEVTVSYDPEWHYPTEAYFDAGEEGSGFKASQLTPVD
jgi:hypothetical protein